MTNLKRKIIVHYHLFKNAGTSVDKLLQGSFGTRWVKWEGDGHQVFPEELAEFVQDHLNIRAVSSHVAVVRLPEVSEIQFYPILFLRHPLDRVPSVYKFERRQELNAPGPNKAKETDLAAYIEWRLDKDHQFRNFQTRRLAAWVDQTGDKNLSILTKAYRALDELPFFGIVENFKESAIRLETWLKPDFPEFRWRSVHANITRDLSEPMESRLQKLQAQIGEELFQRLVEENREDLDLYTTALNIFKNKN